jgi:5-methylcytosine-specific restriction endonuclease McrA
MFGTKFCSIRCFWMGQKITVREIWERDHGICHLCDKWCSLEEASRDHVKPRHYGGRTTWQNIRLAHRDCNSRRGHMDIDDFVLILEMREMAQGKKKPRYS